MTEKLSVKWIAGFWRRIAALIVDTLLLGIVGFILGQAFESIFVQMGEWGRFIGFGIALIYFGVMNSKLFNGQTIGKKLLKLRVVDFNNEALTLGKSILRYVVLALPFVLNGLQFFSAETLPFLVYPTSLIIFGGLFSIHYLYIFNRVTRQSIHDLVVGSYVVNVATERQTVGGVWKVHLVTIAMAFIIASLAPAFIKKPTQDNTFQELVTAQAALTAETDVSHSLIVTGTSTFDVLNEDSKTIRYIRAEIFLKSKNIEDIEFARRMATAIVENYPEVKGKDSLRVVLTYGYAIGIWGQWSRRVYDFIPSDLMDLE